MATLNKNSHIINKTKSTWNFVFIILAVIAVMTLLYIQIDAKYYDLNNMDRNELIVELDKIQGISKDTATRIADNRPYRSVSQLELVHGVGDIKIKRILEKFKLK